MGHPVISKEGGRGLANKTATSYKKGGKVKKTGLAKLHKGEVVVPKKKVKKLPRVMRKG